MISDPTPDQLKKQNEDWIARAMLGEESLIGSLRMTFGAQQGSSSSADSLLGCSDNA